MLLAHLDSGTAYWSLVTSLVAAGQAGSNSDGEVQLREPLSERELTVLRYLQSIWSKRGDRGRDVDLGQHGEDPRAQHLSQARRRHPARCGTASTKPAAAVAAADVNDRRTTHYPVDNRMPPHVPLRHFPTRPPAPRRVCRESWPTTPAAPGQRYRPDDRGWRRSERPEP